MSRSGSCRAQPPGTAPTLGGNLGVTAGCWDQDGSPVLQREAAAPAKAAAHGPAAAALPARASLPRQPGAAEGSACLALPAHSPAAPGKFSSH